MSEINQGQIDTLQQDLVDRLSSEAALTGISIFYEKTQDIESEIDRALGAINGGICVIVTPPKCTVTKPNIPGPYFGDVLADVNVVESVLINQSATGTKKTASYVAELVAHRLHHFVTRDGRCVLVKNITPVADQSYRIYRIPISTAFGLK